jgi:hypothetical protein
MDWFDARWVNGVEVEGKPLLCLRKVSGHDVSKYFDCLKTLGLGGHKANEMRASQNLFATKTLSDLLGMFNNCKLDIRHSCLIRRLAFTR